LQCATQSPRVVVERLDSLGGGVCGDDVVCDLVDGDSSQSILSVSSLSDYQPETPEQSMPEIFELTQPTLEEEEQGLACLDPSQYLTPAPRVAPNLSLNTNITFELEPLLDTPTAETILDNFLAGTDYSMETMESIDNNKWTDGLDDLFPELD